MQVKYFAAVCIAVTILIISCSKKQVPHQTAAMTVTKTAIPAVKKVAVKKTPPPIVHKVIMVNDKAAKKNIDGRLYYDVGGHRYWRNYNDGKYYLFNKSMYTDSAFIPH